MQQCEIVAPVKGDFRTAYALLGIYRVDPPGELRAPAMISSNLAFGGKRSIKSSAVPPHPVEAQITDG